MSQSAKITLGQQASSSPWRSAHLWSEPASEPHKLIVQPSLDQIQSDLQVKALKNKREKLEKIIKISWFVNRTPSAKLPLGKVGLIPYHSKEVFVLEETTTRQPIAGHEYLPPVTIFYSSCM